MAVRRQPQLGMDEKQISDAELENALELRQTKKNAFDAVRAQLAEAHDAATALITKHDMGDGTVIRVGRFRIERKFYPGRSVSFESAGKSRVRIALAGED